jgi:Holliday junction resolvasome RuvABC endonuclease subunit
MRLIRLNAFLNATYKKFGPELVAFEAARHQGIGGAAVSQAELQGVIKLFCESCQLPYIGYSPSTIKKHATGKGTASKDMMVAAATEKFGKVVDDNHADALWIMDYARKEFEK